MNAGVPSSGPSPGSSPGSARSRPSHARVSVGGASLKKAKREVRNRVRTARDALSAAERADLGDRATGRLLELPELAAARTVMAFWSFGSEVSTEPLIRTLHDGGTSIVLPRIVDGDLVPLRYVPGDPTTVTTFGAREPVADAERVSLPSIDVVVTPGVAFDRRGGRVGYGGGFYDRFFAAEALGAFRVGLGFALQLLDGDLPAGHADVRVHAMATDREVVRSGRASSP